MSYGRISLRKEHRRMQELEKQIQALAVMVQKMKDQVKPGNRSPRGIPGGF